MRNYFITGILAGLVFWVCYVGFSSLTGTALIAKDEKLEQSFFQYYLTEKAQNMSSVKARCDEK